MLEKKRIKVEVGKDTYKVEGNIMLYTDEEIADFCDRNNWGYRVYSKNSYEMIIAVYTD